MALTPEIPVTPAAVTPAQVDAFVSQHSQIVAALSANVQALATKPAPNTKGKGNPTRNIKANVTEANRATLQAALTYCGNDATTVSVARKALAVLDLK